MLAGEYGEDWGRGGFAGMEPQFSLLLCALARSSANSVVVMNWNAVNEMIFPIPAFPSIVCVWPAAIKGDTFQI